MKANELKIGNFVNAHLYKNDLILVESICSKNDEIFNSTTGEIPITSIEPIPLTEEWLLKFGFQKEYNNDESEKCNCFYLNNCDDSYYLNFDDNFDDWYLGVTSYGYLKSIEQVHQLQNLYFALTGTELTLNK